jgi:metallo-beta-lactamase family protein
MKVSFLGAAETVTGSRYLIQTPESRVLVDCGLFQGLKKLRQRNWQAFPCDPAAIDAVVVTHAHIDHSGYLPRLCNQGFRGPIYATEGTRDLLSILLPDAGFLQEEEARLANKWGYSKHSPAEPLFTRADAERCLERIVAVRFHDQFEPAPALSARYRRAGHILGSASVSFCAGAVGIAFSGDVGRPADPVMRPPEPLEDADFLVVESTYGDRLHPPNRVLDRLAAIVTRASETGGVVLVPAFAVGRAQHLLHLLAELLAAERIPPLPIFLDSPMAIEATRIFHQHDGEHKLTDEQCTRMLAVARPAPTPEDSKAIDARSEPMIVISASGMATGGRVLHHLKRFLPDERNVVLFTGYQTAGTRGRSLVDGAAEVKIHGRYVRVRARVEQLEGLSAHADYAELIEWLRASRLSPRRVFVTHGEPAAADAFRRRLMDAFGWSVRVPELGESADLA